MAITFAAKRDRSRIVELQTQMSLLDKKHERLHDLLVLNRARSKALEDEIVMLERRLG